MILEVFLNEILAFSALIILELVQKKVPDEKDRQKPSNKKQKILLSVAAFRNYIQEPG